METALGTILALKTDPNIPGARQHFHKSIELDPGHAKAYRWYIWFSIFLSNEGKDRDSQIHLLEEALTKVEPGIEAAESQNDTTSLRKIRQFSHRLRGDLAALYAERGDLDIAMKYVKEALELVKGEIDSDYYFACYSDTKAWVIIRQIKKSSEGLTVDEMLVKYDANFKKAEELLSTALGIFSDDEKEEKADVLFHQGYLEKLRGNIGIAKEKFWECIKLCPGHVEATREMK